MVYLQQLLVTSLSRCNECRGSRSHKLLVIGFCFLLTISTGGSTLGLFTKNGMNSRGEHKCIQLVFISWKKCILCCCYIRDTYRLVRYNMLISAFRFSLSLGIFQRDR